MSMFKHYLLMLFFMLCLGGYLLYNIYLFDENISLVRELGYYLLIAHGMLLGGFIWMFLVKLMSSAFYKEGYADFNIGMAMLAAFGIAIYLNLQAPIEDLIQTDIATLIVAVGSIPLGATMGYRVDLNLE